MHASTPSCKCVGRIQGTSHVLFHVQHAALQLPHAHLQGAFRPQGAHLQGAFRPQGGCACPRCVALPQPAFQGSVDAKEHCWHWRIGTVDYKTRRPVLIGPPGPHPEPHCWPVAGVPPYSVYIARICIIRLPKRMDEMLAHVYKPFRLPPWRLLVFESHDLAGACRYSKQ